MKGKKISFGKIKSFYIYMSDTNTNANANANANTNTNANTDTEYKTEEQECDFLANVPLTKLFQVISTTDEEIARLLICKTVLYAQNTELLIKHHKNTEIITFLYLCEKEQIENELEQLVVIKSCYKYVAEFFQALTENLPGCTADMTFNQLMAKVENRQEQEQQGGVNLKLIIRNFLVSLLLLLSLASGMTEFKNQTSAAVANLPKENATKIANFFSSNDSTTSQNSSVNAVQLRDIASSGIIIQKPMEKAIARLAAVEAAVAARGVEAVVPTAVEAPAAADVTMLLLVVLEGEVVGRSPH
jgi:hypothetical protein